MAGINAISMISYMNNMSASFQGQKLSDATKAKLHALGIETKWITSEADGQIKLKMAQIDKASELNERKEIHQKEEVNEVLESARSLAHKMNISYAETDTANDIIDKIAKRVKEMIAQAGDDENKKANAQYWATKLEEVKTLQKSNVDLFSTMNLSANQNIAFFGLY